MPLELPVLPQLGPLERVIVRPSWADPMFMLATNEWQHQDVSFPTGPISLIAPADPKRWAIGFVDLDAGVKDTFITPDSDKISIGHLLSIDLMDSWYTIHRYGPMVCSEWYAYTVGIGSVRVYTLTISI